MPTSSFFFFNDTATTEIYTLSLHDALPIYRSLGKNGYAAAVAACCAADHGTSASGRPVAMNCARLRSTRDRKSTRLNSSHLVISYAVFCLKKKEHHSVPAQADPADLEVHEG